MAAPIIPQIQAESVLAQEQEYEIYTKKRLLLEAVIENLICLLDHIDKDADYEADASDFEDNGDFEPLLGWENYINQDCKAFQATTPYQLVGYQSPNMHIARLFEAPVLERYKGIYL